MDARLNLFTNPTFGKAFKHLMAAGKVGRRTRRGKLPSGRNRALARRLGSAKPTPARCGRESRR